MRGKPVQVQANPAADTGMNPPPDSSSEAPIPPATPPPDPQKGVSARGVASGTAKSPIPPPQLSQPDMHLPAALTLPGTTDSRPFPTLTAPWRALLRQRLGRAVTTRGVNARLALHMARAEQRADACAGEILQATGRCGPIAETYVSLGAKLTELAEYYLSDVNDPDVDPRERRTNIHLARQCTDTGLRALGEAMKTSLMVAALSPKEPVNPLAAALTQVTPTTEDDTE